MILRRVAFSLIALAVLIAGGGLFLGYPFGEVILAPPTVPARRGAAVILLSGDGGAHTGMAPAVASDLRAEGMPVVLVSTLAFFAKARSDADITAVLRAAMARARQSYGARHLVVIGQSFGADVLPTGLAGLSPAERKAIAGAILVVPSLTIEHRATPFGLFNTSAATPSLPAANRLDWLPLACIHGAKEKEDSACPALKVPGVTRRALPGGHYMNHDDEAVTAALGPIIAADLTKLSSPDHHRTTPEGAERAES